MQHEVAVDDCTKYFVASRFFHNLLMYKDDRVRH